MTARLVRITEDDRSFDIEFWQRAGIEAIFAAAWDMVQEVQAMRGKSGRQPGLQRSVENVQRLRR